MLRFWAQSFLLGVPVSALGDMIHCVLIFYPQEVFVGFRNHQGVIESTRSYRTADLPAMVREESREETPWDANWCLATANTFLTHLRSVLEAAETDARTVWRLELEPSVGIHIWALDDVAEVENGEDRVGFLPTWFYESRHSQMK